MLMHLRSAVLLSSALVLRTAERSLRLLNAMMTARDFLPTGRPCLSAPTCHDLARQLAQIAVHFVKQLFFCLVCLFFQPCIPQSKGMAVRESKQKETQ